VEPSPHHERPIGRLELMADVNARVHELAEKLHESVGADGDEWGFMCECGASECRERVALSLPQFETLRRLGEPILASGHVPLPPA
jgi:hypothetical protein